MQTLEAMKQIVLTDRLHPDLRTFVLREVVGGYDGHQPERQVNAIFEYARDRIRYEQDPVDTERVADIWSTLYGLRKSDERGVYQPEGDCGIKSTFIASCCACIGYESCFVVIKQRANARAFNHVFNVVFVNGKWIYLDATPEEAPFGWKTDLIFEEKWFPIFS